MSILKIGLLEFTAQLIRVGRRIAEHASGNHVAGQLLRCGTSPLANHGEVEAAESRKDFIHKLRICLKELKETRRWLRLVGTAANCSQSNAIRVPRRN